MGKPNLKIVKNAFILISIISISSCSGSSGSKSSGSSGSKNSDEFEKEKNQFTESLVGFWQQKGCDFNDNGDDDYWSKTTFEWDEDGKLFNYGIEYGDSACLSYRGEIFEDSSWGPNEMLFEIVDSFDEGEGGASGYQINISFDEDGEVKEIFTIISKLFEDEDKQKYFWFGDITKDFDGSNSDNRPENFDTSDIGQYRYFKEYPYDPAD